MKQGIVSPVMTIVPQVLTTSEAGTGVDGSDSHGVCHVAYIGDSGDTLSGSRYISPRMEHSDDNSTWAAVDDAGHVVDELNSAFNPSTGDLATINAPTEDQIAVAAHYVGPKRYSRLNLVFTGTHSNGTPCAADAIRSHLRKVP